MGEIIMEEIWKDIKGWEGLYQVSNLGRVKTLERITAFGNRRKIIPRSIKQPSLGKRGYLVVTLSGKGQAKTIPIHRLIAEAFIPNPNNKPCVDHINTDRTDNSLSNLRWVTYKENSNNTLTLQHNRISTKKCWKDGVFENRENVHYRKVAQYTKEGILIKTHDSIIEASKELGIDPSSISAVCLGTNPKRHTAGGFVWKHIGGHYMK